MINSMLAKCADISDLINKVEIIETFRNNHPEPLGPYNFAFSHRQILAFLEGLDNCDKCQIHPKNAVIGYKQFFRKLVIN